MLRIDCPHCGHWAILPNQAADRKAKCLKCAGIFRVQIKDRPPASAKNDVPVGLAQVITDPEEIARIETMLHNGNSSVPPAAPEPAADREPSISPAGSTDEDAIMDMLTGDAESVSDDDLANIHEELGIEYSGDADGPGSGDTSVDLASLSEAGGSMEVYLKQLQSRRSELLYRLGFGVIRGQITLSPKYASLQAAVKEAVIDLDQVNDELKELAREAEAGPNIERRAEMLAIRTRLDKRRERLQARIGRRYRRLGKAIFLDSKLAPPMPDLHRKIEQVDRRIAMLHAGK